MKGLTVRQPWASLIAFGEKTVEVRKWSTSYRGPLLICAGKSGPSKIDGIAMPRGFAVATCNLSDIRRLRRADLKAAHADRIEPGDLAWILTDIIEIEPVPVTGKLRLFDLPSFIAIKPVSDHIDAYNAIMAA